jgi:hypothetical protein
MKKSFLKNFQITGVYSLLSLLLGMTGLMALTSLVFPIITLIISDPLPAWYGLPVQLTLPASEVKRIADTNYSIFPIWGELAIYHMNLLNSVLSGLIPFFVFGSFAYVIYLLRKLLKNIYDEKYFLPENRRIMFTIGTLSIIVPPIIKMIQKAILLSLPKDLVVDGMKVVNPGGIGVFDSIEYLILGLFFFVLADVFREGKKLKEEHDLTV